MEAVQAWPNNLIYRFKYPHDISKASDRALEMCKELPESVLEQGGGRSSADSTEATIDYITIASTGNATDFGDLVTGRSSVAAVSNSTRAVFQGGGSFADGDAARELLDYITIASTGNATDFGDQATEKYASSSLSNSHGGL